PFGPDGISLREALGAIRNNFLVNGTTNQGVGFAGLVSDTVTNGNDTLTTCQGLTTTVWMITITNGPLPDIISPGTEINGTVVRASTNSTAGGGPNNTAGPKVVIDFNGNLGFNVTGDGAIIRGL